MIASLDILCCNTLNLKNKITKIEHKKMFCGPSKILKNISWPINICLKYFMTPAKTLRPPSYILNVWSLNKNISFRDYISGTLLPGWSKYLWRRFIYIVKFSYWSKFHINIITGSGIFFSKRLTINPKIGNTTIWVLPNILRLGRARVTKFGTNVSSKMLLNFAQS